MNTTNRPIWKISPGEGAYQWFDWRKYRVIAIGWTYDGKVGDLNNYHKIENLKKKLAKVGNPKPSYAANQLWSFSKDVKVNDIVVAYGGYTILDIALVKSGCRLKLDKLWKDDRLYGNRRKVKWFGINPIKLKEPKIKKFLSQNKTIFEIDHKKTLDFVKSILSEIPEYKIGSRIEEEVKHKIGPDIEVDFDTKSSIDKEVKNAIQAMKNPKLTEVRLEKEFKKLKFKKLPKQITTSGRIKFPISPDINYPTDLMLKKIEDELVYTPSSISNKKVLPYLKSIKEFRSLLEKILAAMTMPSDIIKGVVRISLDEPYRDAYKIQGGIFFNVRNFLKHKSKYYWVFTAAREVAYLMNPQRNYRHMKVMRALVVKALENLT